ncbi:MAG: DNA primase [Nitrosomonas sp.]|uniref:DNA primase n=1 Tax=Nitrosomonas sp. TaxID=42353 RepID=UPI002735BBFA|nr:DNA primase [Nitrosomonas sp.]MDP3280798.1 DNA primase [Nitrosomonas sp.]
MNAPLTKPSHCNSSDEILSKITPLLKGVIKRHNGGYLAFCPSHDDLKGRSLAVSLGRQGQALMHCFAGCSIHEITAAIDLNPADLFPRESRYEPQTRSYFNESLILEALRHDALVVLIAARTMLTGKALPESDIDFLSKAIIRINEAASFSGRFK